MKTIAEVVRFIEAYNVGGRSAKSLRAALLKRIETKDPTDEIIEQLTFDAANNLLELYGSVDGIRRRIDDAVAFMRYLEVPFAGTMFHFVSRLEWDRIEDAFEALKPIDTRPETAFMTPNRAVQPRNERMNEHEHKHETNLKIKDD